MPKSLGKFSHWIGAAGVHPGENTRARRTGVILEAPMLMAAIWILLNWGFKSSAGESTDYQVYDMWLWAFFLLETTLLSFLVNDTRHYLKTNWLNLLIILFGMPLLWQWNIYLGALRLLRLVILATLLVHLGGRVRTMLSRNELGATIIASLIVIIMAGIMMSSLDPGIESPAEGVWWAWVTITTVGYGDIVPESVIGKVLASFIMLLGLGLFAMLTASFAAFFMARKEEEIIDSEHNVHKRLTQMEHKLGAIDSKLERLLEGKTGGKPAKKLDNVRGDNENK